MSATVQYCRVDPGRSASNYTTGCSMLAVAASVVIHMELHILVTPSFHLHLYNTVVPLR
jgi:hypothetical protein